MGLPLPSPTQTPPTALGNCTITQLTTPESVLENITELSFLLQECVHEGHSMGFLAPLSLQEATSYWTDLISSITKGAIHLFILTTPHPDTTTPIVIGTVQLAPMPKATHSHRADVNKLIISSKYQRMGLARKVMEYVEDFARKAGKEVLTLTTVTESAAREMYLRFGWEEFGICKKYASWPDRRRADVSFFSRDLGAGDRGERG
jgi:ribosomal protein S18 acetylase RimI-like enzyme